MRDDNMTNPSAILAMEGDLGEVTPGSTPAAAGGETPTIPVVPPIEEKPKTEEEPPKTEETKPAIPVVPPIEEKPTPPAEKTQEELDREAEEQRVAQETAVENQRKEATANLLKELGISTLDELKSKLNPPKELTPEEKTRQENLYNINLAKYAVENNAMTNDELISLQTMQRMNPEQLVFDAFSKEYTESHKDRKGEDGNAMPVTSDEIRDQFNQLYHLDSESAYLKAQGQRNIESQANAMKGALQNKYDELKDVYDSDMKERAELPAFKKFFIDTIQSAMPEKMELGDGDDKVMFELKDLDKAAIIKSIESKFGEKEFADFFKGKGTNEQRDRIKQEVEKEILFQNRKEIVKLARKVGFDAGTASNARHDKAPFVEPGKEKVNKPVVTGEITAEDDAALDRAIKSQSRY